MTLDPNICSHVITPRDHRNAASLSALAKTWRGPRGACESDRMATASGTPLVAVSGTSRPGLAPRGPSAPAEAADVRP